MGFARLETVAEHARLEQLSVDPAHGRRGIGAELLLAACRWAAGQGHSAITKLSRNRVSNGAGSDFPP